MDDSWRKCRAAVLLLRRRADRSLIDLYRTVRAGYMEMQTEAAQLNVWGSVPASAPQRDAVLAVEAALKRLRAAAADLPPGLHVELVPQDLDHRIQLCGWAMDAFRPTTDQQDTRTKLIAVAVARNLLRHCDLPATTTVGSDWCRLAAALHCGDERRHSELRSTVLKAAKPAVV